MIRLYQTNEQEQPQCFYDSQDEPIVLSKSLIDILLKENHPADLIALYCFYYYTAKWQHTNQPKATIQYVANGLNWGTDKARRIKQELLKLHLIENVVERREGNKIAGHFIKVNFIWKNHPSDFPPYGKNHPMENNKVNALSSNNKNIYPKISKNLNPTKEQNIIPPNLEMITNYCEKRKDNVDPKKFYNFYASKGWMIGKNKMKDWHAAVRTWENNDKSKSTDTPKKGDTKIIHQNGTYTAKFNGKEWIVLHDGVYFKERENEVYMDNQGNML